MVEVELVEAKATKSLRRSIVSQSMHVDFDDSCSHLESKPVDAFQVEAPAIDPELREARLEERHRSFRLRLLFLLRLFFSFLKSKSFCPLLFFFHLSTISRKHYKAGDNLAGTSLSLSLSLSRSEGSTIVQGI